MLIICDLLQHTYRTLPYHVRKLLRILFCVQFSHVYYNIRKTRVPAILGVVVSCALLLIAQEEGGEMALAMIDRLAALKEQVSL